MNHPDEQVAEAARDPNAGGIQPWQWPEWLECAAIARDGCGAWYGYDQVPELITCDSVWASCGELFPLSGVVDTSGFPQGPWNESLRLNPNYRPF